jgi:hypothetical protein
MQQKKKSAEEAQKSAVLYGWKEGVAVTARRPAPGGYYKGRPGFLLRDGTLDAARYETELIEGWALLDPAERKRARPTLTSTERAVIDDAFPFNERGK